MALCNVSTQDRSWREGQMNEVWNNFSQNHQSIVDRFTDRNGKFLAGDAAEALKGLLQNNLEVPWEPHSPLRDHHFRRAKVEIQEYADALRGNFKNLAWYTPEGISKQDPVARKFYTDLNNILNFERVQVNKIIDSNAKISSLMLEAYISEHQVSNPTMKRAGHYLKMTESPAIERIRRLRKDLAEDPQSVGLQAKFVDAIKYFTEKDVEGRTIKQFIKLVHLSNTDFKNARKTDWKDPNEFLTDGKTPNPDFGLEVTFNSHVYQAVEVARQQLNDMGKVQVRGLEMLQKLIAVKYTGEHNINEARRMDKKVDRFITKIEDTIKDMKMGMDPKTNKEGYFPHLEFGSMTAIKEHLSKAFAGSLASRDIEFQNIIDNIMHKSDWLPEHTRKRGNIDFYWEQDPMLVLSEYGNQAASFNKLIGTQLSYLTAMRGLGSGNMKFVKQMKRFIDEEYTVFTEGSATRADWVNNAVSSLNAFQTARTMGMNITGAIKNGASVVHFYSRVGVKLGIDQRMAYKTDSEFRTVMNRVEKEAGFLFTDAASELYAEGLITKEQRDKGNFRFNEKNGQFEFKEPEGWVKARGIIAKGGSFVLDKALFFHRLTENAQRKQMFRTSFYKKYKWLKDNGYDPIKAERFAKNWALRMVNGFAYEYAAHAKSKIVRGQWTVHEKLADGTIYKKSSGLAGGISEVAFHLLHYPMSLAETHLSAFKGIKKSLKAKQGLESEEIQYAMRYAGVASLLGAMSVFLNINLFNIFENETVERIHRVYEDLTEYDSDTKGTFGLMSEFTGPTLGHLKYFGIMGGIIDVDRSTLEKILFGNVDYADDADKMSEMYSAYQLSTEWGVIKNKLYPSYKRGGLGRDFATHTLKLYPSWWTKGAGKYLPGRGSAGRSTPGTRRGLRKQGLSPNVEAALKLLESNFLRE